MHGERGPISPLPFPTYRLMVAKCWMTCSLKVLKSPMAICVMSFSNIIFLGLSNLSFSSSSISSSITSAFESSTTAVPVPAAFFSCFFFWWDGDRGGDRHFAGDWWYREGKVESTYQTYRHTYLNRLDIHDLPVQIILNAHYKGVITSTSASNTSPLVSYHITYYHRRPTLLTAAPPQLHHHHYILHLWPCATSLQEAHLLLWREIDPCRAAFVASYWIISSSTSSSPDLGVERAQQRPT